MSVTADRGPRSRLPTLGHTSWTHAGPPSTATTRGACSGPSGDRVGRPRLRGEGHSARVEHLSSLLRGRVKLLRRPVCRYLAAPSTDEVQVKREECESSAEDDAVPLRERPSRRGSSTGRVIMLVVITLTVAAVAYLIFVAFEMRDFTF
jgi:hypothetical protein